MVPLQGLCAHQAHGFFLRSIQVLFTNGITELCPSAKLNRTHGWGNATFAVNGHLPAQWTPCIHLVGLLGCCLSVTWTLACWTLGNWCRPAPRARQIRRMGTYSSLFKWLSKAKQNQRNKNPVIPNPVPNWKHGSQFRREFQDKTSHLRCDETTCRRQWGPAEKILCHSWSIQHVKQASSSKQDSVLHWLKSLSRWCNIFQKLIDLLSK